MPKQCVYLLSVSMFERLQTSQAVSMSYPIGNTKTSYDEYICFR